MKDLRTSFVIGDGGEVGKGIFPPEYGYDAIAIGIPQACAMNIRSIQPVANFTVVRVEIDRIPVELSALPIIRAGQHLQVFIRYDGQNPAGEPYMTSVVGSKLAA